MSVDEQLTATLAACEAIGLDVLGTPAEIEAEAPELAATALAPQLASAFCVQLKQGPWTDEHLPGLISFARGLSAQRSYLALREAADVLVGDEQALHLVGQTIHDVLLPDSATIADNPLLAGLRLDVALEIVVRTQIAPYRLLALLTSDVDDYPEEFGDPLARALGLAADIWAAPGERERFASNLAKLADLGSEDALYEAAVSKLRDALLKEDKNELVAEIRAVRDEFVSIASRFESRDDAAAFAQTCTALIAFDEADRAALSASAEAARTVADQRALLVHGMHSRYQAIARHSAQLAWASLAWRLETAIAEVDEEAFLDTWVAVNAIVEVYEADRQFANFQTVSTLIRPRLINNIAQRRAMAHQLERAVVIDRQRETPELPDDIYELLDAVHRARSAGRESAGDSEEPSHPEPYLGALLGSAVDVLDGLAGPDRMRLEHAAHQAFVGTIANDRPTNELVERLTARLVRDLTENESFVGAARMNFTFMVLYTVRFLVYVGDHSRPYTKLIPKGGPAPLEVELQEHFYEFLCGTELVGRVGMEHRNIAGGRADVITTFDGAQRYVTEVKRELNDASRNKLESAYIAQALEYQSTNEPLGQLLVLDLTNHSAGTPHINDSIWVTHRRDEEGRVRSSAVVAVVRGNRPTPHAMKG